MRPTVNLDHAVNFLKVDELDASFHQANPPATSTQSVYAAKKSTNPVSPNELVHVLEYLIGILCAIKVVRDRPPVLVFSRDGANL